MIIRVQDKSKKLGARAWIYIWPGGSVLESSASLEIKLNICHAPLWQGFSSALFRWQINICHAP